MLDFPGLNLELMLSLGVLTSINHVSDKYYEGPRTFSELKSNSEKLGIIIFSVSCQFILFQKPCV